MSASISPRDLKVGQHISRVTVDLDVVWVEVGRVTPVKTKRGDRQVTSAYKVFPSTWLTDQDKVESDRSMKHFAPFIVASHNKVEVKEA